MTIDQHAPIVDCSNPHLSTAIVLAGGKSQRMGRDKALLVYEGRTFLEHVVMTLFALTEKIIVVAATAERYALPGVRVAADMFQDTGPVGGILTGLILAGNGAHYVVPCDMPTISPAVLKLLRASIEPSWDAVVPEINGELEPLYAVYQESAIPKLTHYLEHGRRSARGALEALSVRHIGEDVLRSVDPDFVSFANVNTPEQYAQLGMSESMSNASTCVSLY